MTSTGAGSFDRPGGIPDAVSVLAAFGLAGRVVDLTPVSGAWSNRVYRLTTSRGVYAVKQMRNPWRLPRWQDWLDAAWRFEQRAFDAGIAMPAPVPNPLDGGCLAWVPPSPGSAPVPVRVHHWVEGQAPSPQPVDRDVAIWAGRTLAMLHRLDIRSADRELYPAPNTDTADGWAELAAAARRMGAPWAADLAAVTPHVEQIAALSRQARDQPADETFSHGDIDQKNLLLTPDGPMLCDWDVAMPMVPRRELADVSLSLAGWRDVELARDVIRAYRVAGGGDTVIEPPDLGPSLTSSLDWLAFNVERSIGLRTAEPDDVDLARRLVPQLIAALPGEVGAASRVREILAT
ncbi:aminoglycoside phosphotransferase family protein [Phytoactinopolyspora limicola]|uniref:aminoglycoside phosphotransferase family protein n=1 Tax=Phytoactinopolyspora limicola TaxID=2715536 RepID=UPI001408AA54|nr:aminoglycoside phosphotransferase family protein [Phytoactinopolyspora limicola]